MYPGVANLTFGNRTRLNSNRSIGFGNGTYRTHSKILPVEHKTSLIWFQRRCCVQISCMYWLQFQTRVRKNSKDVTEGAKREMNNSGSDG